MWSSLVHWSMDQLARTPKCKAAISSILIRRTKMIRTGILAIPITVILCAVGCGGSDRSFSSANKPAGAPITADQSRTGQSTAPTDAEGDQNAKAASNIGGTSPSTAKAPNAADKLTLKQTSDATIDTAPTDRKIIRNADLTIESETPDEAQRSITTIAERTGGFVVESQSTSSDPAMNRRDIVNMSVRVPAQKFSDVLDEIRRSGTRVLTETVRGDDVTEEFIDVEARLRAKKALEAQFLEIMKRSTNVNEALSVQREISEVRSEIERIEGRKRFLENQSSLSTIKIRIQTSTSTSIAASSSGFIPRLTQAFMTGVDVALSFILGLMTVIIALLPFVIFVVLPIYLLLRYLWRRRARKKTVDEIIREEISST